MLESKGSIVSIVKKKNTECNFTIILSEDTFHIDNKETDSTIDIRIIMMVAVRRL